MFDDESRLLMRARAGDQSACFRLHDRHAAVVLSLCRRAGLDSIADAEDATQETFIRAFRQLSTLQDLSRFRPWLYRIARNVCSEQRRSTRRRRAHEGAAMIARLHAAPVALPDRADHHETMRRLGEAIDQLDERERVALHLHYLEADPVQAARDALGLSRSAYYKLLARARDRLASLMHDEVPVP